MLNLSGKKCTKLKSSSSVSASKTESSSLLVSQGSFVFLAGFGAGFALGFSTGAAFFGWAAAGFLVAAAAVKLLFDFSGEEFSKLSKLLSCKIKQG